MCNHAPREAESNFTPLPEKEVPQVLALPEKSLIAKQLDSLGYLNIAEQDPSIIVSLMYARADNFTGEVLYTELKEAYLHPDAMKCLLKAQQLLKAEHPELTLAVFDAARPMSVQQKMWNTVKEPQNRTMYRILLVAEECIIMV